MPPVSRLAVKRFARTSFWLRYTEDDGYQLLVRHMTDVITRHGRNGAVLSISPAAEPLFGAKYATCWAMACSIGCMWRIVRPI